MSPTDCPAVHYKSEYYPYGDRIPTKVKMLKTVTADHSEFFDINPAPLAPAGAVLSSWTNSHGAIAVVLNDGIHLGIKPGEFEIVEWRT